MKTYTIIIVFWAAVCLTSCSNWLDLSPETEATEKQMFSTGDGYRTVLNGLYKSMGTSELYGRELSFGVVDCISQQYNLTVDKMGREIYRDAAKFSYKTNVLHPVIDEVWSKGFNIIANANNLLQNIQVASADLFTDGESERRLIMGEAYACRAMMHFDLLRLFAPAPVNDDKRSYVPYVETYPNIQANGIGVEMFLGKVITDLELARTLVMDFDTTALGKDMMATANSRFFDKRNDLPSAGQQVNALYKGRGYRLNYYSITALLARVYQYAGKYAEALKCADEVIAFKKPKQNSWDDDKPIFKDDFNGLMSGSFESRKDLRVIPNLIFAIYNGKAYDDLGLKDFFNMKSDAPVPNLFLIKDYSEVFANKDKEDEAKIDVRARYQTYKVGESFLSGKYYCSVDEVVRDQNLSIIPMIRLTEMSYIVAECYARQGDFGKAESILNGLRGKRSCMTAIHIANWADFTEELVRDARREWISEGQLFYLYKRLNANVDFGKNVIRPLNRAEYLLPIPDSQSI
ncbi:MAG: RagB/SusD family nutrient uptake outer membrane protein [Odoribacter sp.]